MNYLLLLLLIVPLIGALITAAMPNPRAAKTWALAVSLMTVSLQISIGISR